MITLKETEINLNFKDRIIASDTDSLFIHVKELLLHRFPDIDLNNREEVVPKVLEIASELQKACNDNLHVLVQELFNVKYPNEPHYFELKQEVVLDRGYFAGKRRYAQHIVNKEGVPSEVIHGDKTQTARQRALNRFKEKRSRVAL